MNKACRPPAAPPPEMFNAEHYPPPLPNFPTPRACCFIVSVRPLIAETHIEEDHPRDRLVIEGQIDEPDLHASESSAHVEEPDLHPMHTISDVDDAELQALDAAANVDRTELEPPNLSGGESAEVEHRQLQPGHRLGDTVTQEAELHSVHTLGRVDGRGHPAAKLATTPVGAVLMRTARSSGQVGIVLDVGGGASCPKSLHCKDFRVSLIEKARRTP